MNACCSKPRAQMALKRKTAWRDSDFEKSSSIGILLRQGAVAAYTVPTRQRNERVDARILGCASVMGGAC